MALTTRAAAKIFLQIPSSDTSQDDLIDQLITYAGAAINTYTGRVLESATYTDYYSGNGLPRLALRLYPVTSVTSVYLDAKGYFGDGSGAFSSDYLLTAGTDYVLQRDNQTQSDRGYLVRVGWGTQGDAATMDWVRSDIRSGRGSLAGARRPYWPVGQGNIKVTYVAGYTSVPADLAGAANALIAWVMSSGPKGQQVTSESYEEYSVGLSAGSANGWPNIVTVVLNRYRQIAF